MNEKSISRPFCTPFGQQKGKSAAQNNKCSPGMGEHTADMKKSSSNFLRDGVSALTVCAMGPLSLYLVLRK